MGPGTGADRPPPAGPVPLPEHDGTREVQQQGGTLRLSGPERGLRAELLLPRTRMLR